MSKDVVERYFDSKGNEVFQRADNKIIINTSFPRDNKGRILWIDSIGLKVEYVYNNTTGEFEILNCDKGGVLTLKTDKFDVFSISTSNLKYCRIGKAIGLIDYSLLYGVGDIVNGLEILECIPSSGTRENFNRKSYKVKCIKDGYLYNVRESSLKQGIGCPVCSGRNPITGVNDLATMFPYLLKFIVDKEVAKTLMPTSHGKIMTRCPDCGFEKNMLILNLTRRGFSCPICGDGMSIPNKFTRSILKQLDTKFTPEKSFTWSNNKKYDVFISKSNCIIEAHGIQHYEQSTRGRSLKEEQENDKLKKQMALNNGIKHYITLDCRYSDLNWMKNSIINSELGLLFDLSKVDFVKAFKYAQSNIVKEVCAIRDKYHGNITSTKLCEITGIGKSTIIRYLKIGTECGFLKYPYSSIDEMRKTGSSNGKNLSKVVYMYDRQGKYIREFNSSEDAYKATNIPKANIYNSCANKSKPRSCYIWRYFKVDNILEYENQKEASD